MKQPSLSSQTVFENYVPKSRRELFLEEMEQVIPWCRFQALVEPHYAKAGNGRHSAGVCDHAVDGLRAAVVQSVETWRGRGVVRVGGAAAVCGHDLGAPPTPDEILPLPCVRAPRWSISTCTANGWTCWGYSVSGVRKTASRDTHAQQNGCL
jgi:hypothetical protein